MTNFEKVAVSPETLGAFLAYLPIATGPWDELFHRRFCDSCIDSNGTQNCDTPGCPHEAERNNPTWWLMQAVEGEQAGPAAAWRDGRLVLEQGEIIPMAEEHPANGTCEAFNVWLNKKGPEGKILRNIKKIVLPDVSTNEDGRVDPMAMKLVFGGCEDAAEIIKRLGEKCKLEIRAAVQNWNEAGQIEYHGHRYILEAAPLELESDILKSGGGTGLTIGFLVYRYTATVGDTELWDFEWTAQRRERRR